MQKQAVIIIGHGSKSQQAVEDFNYVVDLLKDKLQNEFVFGAHMELAQPSIQDVVAEINKQEINSVKVIPYFLFNGNHIKEDIPEILEELRGKYPNMTFSFGKPIGKEPLMADIMLKKIQELA